MNSTLKALLVTAIAATIACGGDDSTAPPGDNNGGGGAKTVTIEPDRDETLYEQLPASASSDTLVANGGGRYWYVGKTSGINSGDRPRIRRGLVRFDVAGSIPAGSTVDSVRVSAYMNKLPNTGVIPPKAADISIHRVTADWGEVAGPAILGSEGAGRAVEPGEVSWLHTFFDTDFWTTPGGDYIPTARATTHVDTIGPYIWGSTALMVSDVQLWLDNDAVNFGWLFRGGEGVVDSVTAKQFGTRENPDANRRTKLTIFYTEP